MKTILYFSPTGNVKYLAQRLAREFGQEKETTLPLEFTDSGSLQPTEHLVIMFSIHAFNPPRTVGRFVKSLPPGLCESVSLIAVGCADSWINKAASRGLGKTLRQKGYLIHQDRQMAMPLSFVISFPEEMVGKLVEQGQTHMREIAEAINQDAAYSHDVPLKSKVIHVAGKVEDGAARLFGLELHANNNCTSCGICVKNCPEGNIKFNKKNKPKFGLKCLMCMRCIYNCPEEAITPRLAKFLPVKGGYKSPKA